jgi:hypothetical protein
VIGQTASITRHLPLPVAAAVDIDGDDGGAGEAGRPSP